MWFWVIGKIVGGKCDLFVYKKFFFRELLRFGIILIVIMK